MHESKVEQLRRWTTSGPDEDDASNNMIIFRDTNSKNDTQEGFSSFTRTLRTTTTCDCRGETLTSTLEYKVECPIDYICFGFEQHHLADRLLESLTNVGDESFSVLWLDLYHIFNNENARGQSTTELFALALSSGFLPLANDGALLLLQRSKDAFIKPLEFDTARVIEGDGRHFSDPPLGPFQARQLKDSAVHLQLFIKHKCVALAIVTKSRASEFCIKEQALSAEMVASPVAALFHDPVVVCELEADIAEYYNTLRLSLTFCNCSLPGRSLAYVVNAIDSRTIRMAQFHNMHINLGWITMVIHQAEWQQLSCKCVKERTVQMQAQVAQQEDIALFISTAVESDTMPIDDWDLLALMGCDSQRLFRLKRDIENKFSIELEACVFFKNPRLSQLKNYVETLIKFNEPQVVETAAYM